MKVAMDVIVAVPHSGGKDSRVTKYFPLKYGGIKIPWSKGSTANGLAFLSATEGWDPDGFRIVPSLEDQAWLAHQKMADRLQEMGTSMENIVMMTTYSTRIQDVFRETRWVSSKFYGEKSPTLLSLPPSGTLIEVRGLWRKGMQIGMDAIAALP